MLYVLQCEREKPHPGHYGEKKVIRKEIAIERKIHFPPQNFKTLQTLPLVCVSVHLQGRVEVISHSSVSSSTSSPSPSPSERPAGPPTPSSSSTPTPTQTPPQPEIIAIDREAASKGLIEWLRQNPGYSMDLPAFAHVSLMFCLVV